MQDSWQKRTTNKSLSSCTCIFLCPLPFHQCSLVLFIPLPQSQCTLNSDSVGRLFIENIGTIRNRILKIYLKYLPTPKTYKRRGGYTKIISNMDAGWTCTVVLTIRPSLSLERGPPPGTQRTGDCRTHPFGTSVNMKKTFPSSVLKPDAYNPVRVDNSSCMLMKIRLH